MTILIAVLWRLAAAPAPPSLDALGWLAGCWESRSGDRVTLEMWSPPEGGLMVGASRTVAGGRARAFEHLAIRETADGLVYTAVPSGQSETGFASSSVTDDGFVVENPDHDFPTRITYRRTNAMAFTALVQRPGRDGVLDGFRIDFGRVSCEAAATG